MTPPAAISHYKLISKLGEGGMGAVYRATDTKLKREVAIKMLPDALAGNSDYLARFRREAQILATLNHPNIAAIYGVEDRALVMELVPGETLGQRMESPLQLEEALVIAYKIAEALEAAHEKGIVHRDLKPANVKVSAQLEVKVLDFGLAKIPEEASSRSGEFSDNFTTVGKDVTAIGTIMGTPGYMAPEQAAGKPVDRRADIWSFGVILYEMCSGKRLFDGETASHTLASVLKDPIDFSVPSAPPPIRHLLERCLDRNPRERLRDIGEARIAIRDYLTNPTGSVPKNAARRTVLPWVVTAVALTLAGVVTGVWWWRSTRSTELRPLARLSVEVARDMPITRGYLNGGIMALSPDGTRLVVALRGVDGAQRLYTRPLHQGDLTPLAGTEGADSPFFSPTGQWIGFVAGGKLKKIRIEGGSAVTLCEAPQTRGASWGDDGSIVFAPQITAGLARVSAAGGAPAPLTKLEPGEATHRWPHVLPGAQAVLFTSHTGTFNYDDANIEVCFLNTGQRKTVQRGGFSGQYVALPNGSGRLLYLRQNTLFAAPFDLKRLEVTGTAVPVLEGVGGTAVSGGDFTFSQSGTFVWMEGTGAAGTKIHWLESSGKLEPLLAERGLYYTPRFSPDGKRLAFAMATASRTDLWVMDVNGGAPSRLTFLEGRNEWPVWLPDSEHIVFRSTDPKAPGMYWTRADAAGEAQRLTDQMNDFPHSITSDGKRIAFQRPGNGGSFDLFTAAMEGDPDHPKLGKPELFVGTPFIEVLPQFSPDGRWIAYMSQESGLAEIYVRPFPGPGGRWQISAGGGDSPLWSPNGRELLYEARDGHVMAVSYTPTGGNFNAGRPRVWSERPVYQMTPVVTWDLAPDGNRLAVILPESSEKPRPSTHLTFLLNFFDEIQRRTSGGEK